MNREAAPEPQKLQNNGKALASLLNQLNLPTLAMVILMGGGNWFATKTTSDEQRTDILRAVRQIRDLHDALNEFEDRQKDAINKATTSLANQSSMLRNQSEMLDNQLKLLQQLKQKQ